MKNVKIELNALNTKTQEHKGLSPTNGSLANAYRWIWAPLQAAPVLYLHSSRDNRRGVWSVSLGRAARATGAPGVPPQPRRETARGSGSLLRTWGNTEITPSIRWSGSSVLSSVLYCCTSRSICTAHIWKVHFGGFMAVVDGACIEVGPVIPAVVLFIDALHCLLHSVSFKHLKTKERPIRTTITLLFEDWHTVSSTWRFP